MSENVTRRGAAKMVVLGMVVTLATAVPAAVWASHHFNDVPDGHPFHDEISAIAGAGITTGFGDGGFHPSDPITRQAMAAFLERGLGRVGSNTSGFDASTEGTDLAADDVTTLTGVSIDPGATAAGAGFVLLIGTATVQVATESECPCPITLEIVQDESTVVGRADFDVRGVDNGLGFAGSSGMVQATVPVDGAATGEFTLRATVNNTAASLRATGALSVLYVPFGPDGDDTLAYCADEESEPNNSVGQAVPLVAQPVSGCLEPTPDDDYYSIFVPNSHRLRATTFGLGGPGTCDTDTYVRIKTPGGLATIANNDNAGGNLCSDTTTSSLAPDTYLVQVSGATNSITGSYQLLATVIAP